jgi:hypothetical protein
LLTNTTNGVRIKSWQVNTDTAAYSTHSDRNNLVRTTLTWTIRQNNTCVSEATYIQQVECNSSCVFFPRAAWASRGTCGSRAS